MKILLMAVRVCLGMDVPCSGTYSGVGWMISFKVQ